MRALVQATLVAHDLARVERGAAPRGRLGGVAVEAAAAEVLRLLARGVVGVLHGQARVRGTCTSGARGGREMRGMGEVRVGGGEVGVHVRGGGGGAAVEDTGLRVRGAAPSSSLISGSKSVYWECGEDEMKASWWAPIESLYWYCCCCGINGGYCLHLHAVLAVVAHIREGRAAHRGELCGRALLVLLLLLLLCPRVLLVLVGLVELLEERAARAVVGEGPEVGGPGRRRRRRARGRGGGRRRAWHRGSPGEVDEGCGGRVVRGVEASE